MIIEQIEELEKWVDENLFDGGKFVGLKKRGHWWMQNSCGYTSMIELAGRYTREEAARKAYPHDEPVTVHEFPVRQWARDKASAMEVLNKCYELRPQLTTAINKGTTGWHIQNLDKKTMWQTDDSLLLAICLFAKKLFEK